MTLKELFNELPKAPDKYSTKLDWANYRRDFDQRIRSRSLIMATLIHNFRREVRTITGRAPSYTQAGIQVRQQLANA